MITIDGSFGEGGGQIVRSSLALSLITGKPFRIENIRAGRKKPGLSRQHSTAVAAAAQVGDADVRGNAIGSQSVFFAPRSINAGDYHFSIGTAGSTSLVLQTILPALLIADKPSRITLEGGTHNPFAPPFSFLEKVFVPIVNRMGPRIAMELQRPGFFPAGGGLVAVTVTPRAKLDRIDIIERGKIVRRSATALVAHLPEEIGHRELKVIGDRLSWSRERLEVITVQNSRGPGNAVIIEIESEYITEMLTAFGRKGLPAERVPLAIAEEARQYLEAGVPVGRHLADQILIPMALAGGGTFKTLPMTLHATTNMEVLKAFLDIDIAVKKLDKREYEVTIIS